MKIYLKNLIVVISLIFSFTQAFAGDAILQQLNLQPYTKLNTEYVIKGRVKNLSGSNITSFRTGWRLDNGVNNISNLTNIGGGGLTTGNTYLPFTDLLNFLNVTSPGQHVIKVWVKATGDTNPLNDTITYNFKALATYVNRVALFEESSGTWCQFCPPASTVVNSIDNLSNAAVAVFHHSDIYSTTEGEDYYNPYFGGSIFTPGAMINMGEYGNYSINSYTTEWYGEMSSRNNAISPIELLINPTFNSSSRLLNVDLTSTFKLVENGDYYLNVYIVEDGIVGTQVNATNPYTHNHVVRKMLGGSSGTSGIIPLTPTLNTPYTNSYSFVIPASWNVNNLSLIGLIYSKNGNNKYTQNAINYSFSQLLSTTDFSVSPNPAEDTLIVDDLYFEEGNTLSIYNANGQLVLNENLNSKKVELTISNFPSGIYLIKVKTSEGVLTKRFVKK